MARRKRKAQLEYIENKKSLNFAFKSRRESLKTKVDDLCILSDVPALLIMYHPDSDELSVWPNREEAEELLRKYMRVPPFMRMRNMKDQEGYMGDRIARMQAERTRVLQKNSEMTMNDAIDKIERKGKLFHEFSYKELTDLNSFLKEKMGKIKNLIDHHGHKKISHPKDIEARESYDHIMNQIGVNPTDSLFSSLMRIGKRKQYSEMMTGISSSSIGRGMEGMLQPKTCLGKFKNVAVNGMEIPPSSNKRHRGADNMDNDFGLKHLRMNQMGFSILDMSFYGDDAMRGDVGGSSIGHSDGSMLHPPNNGGGLQSDMGLPPSVFGDNNVGSTEGLPPNLFGGIDTGVDDDGLPFNFTEILQYPFLNPLE